MSSESELVEVGFELDADQDNATLLLAAAEELDLPPSVVTTSSTGFLAPKEVVDKAFGNQDEKKASAKKAPAKKTAAKSTTKTQE